MMTNPCQCASPEDAGAPTDEQLMALVASRDSQAFAELYDRFADLVYGLAVHMLGREAAEEATQDVFLRLWQRSVTFDPAKGPFRPWFLSMARHLFLDRIRRRSLEDRFSVADRIDLLLGRVESGGSTIEELAWLNERAKVLRSTLFEIPADQRQVLVLAYFGGMSESQMARRLNTPLGTVKKRIRLGMQKLRSRLGELDVFENDARRPTSGGET
jgi:RNA polymerase sigma-70 factor, ECF subfamily